MRYYGIQNYGPWNVAKGDKIILMAELFSNNYVRYHLNVKTVSNFSKPCSSLCPLPLEYKILPVRSLEYKLSYFQ